VVALQLLEQRLRMVLQEGHMVAAAVVALVQHRALLAEQDLQA
jgi:hypothetical protein